MIGTGSNLRVTNYRLSEAEDEDTEKTPTKCRENAEVHSRETEWVVYLSRKLFKKTKY